MSWDASLFCDHCGNELWSQNYTHNTNEMIATVLEEAGSRLESYRPIYHTSRAWFDLLEGKSGQEAGQLLDCIVEGLEAAPERFRAMDPPNGWGSYDTLLPVLREMRKVSRANPHAKWRVCG